MAKINIKNEQLAKAVNLGNLKEKLAKKKLIKEKSPKKTTDAKEKEKKETKPATKKPAAKKATAKTTAATETHKTKVKKAPLKEPKTVKSKLIESKTPTPKKKEAPSSIKKLPEQEIKKEKAVKEGETSLSTKPQVKKHEKSDPSKTKPLLIKGTKRKGFYDIETLQKEGYTFKGADRRQGEWRRRRGPSPTQREVAVVRPTSITVTLPISIKNLSEVMKVKASLLITTLFKEGLTYTLNDNIEDETVLQLVGHENGCEILIDSSEEERIRITDKSIKEEINETDPSLLKARAPVITFMGHVDHGKTSLIDAIRKSNRVDSEAGDITQHIGAFSSSTSQGNITILDTPGHEAFSAMRGRGATVTDIIVLVVAGDEGIRDQTVEALKHAQDANVEIIVAINKCDKEGFDPEQVYRQLTELELMPEQWGGKTIMINCSAKTGEAVVELTEMLALQAEMLELKANPTSRARGSVLESETHRGRGNIATLLVQNGTLKVGDAAVFGHQWGKIKTIHDSNGKKLEKAGPSTPLEITGLSGGTPAAGQEFIVVGSEKEAREIAKLRHTEYRQRTLSQKRTFSLDHFMQSEEEVPVKKLLDLILKADVHGSLEALKTSLQKIPSKKIEVNIISSGVGQITESDVILAKTSKAQIIGFHTNIESHAVNLLKKHTEVEVINKDIIYHIIDHVKATMVDRLDKIPKENDKGKAEIKAVFKSTKLGKIAGCIMTDGIANRNDNCRVVRNQEVIFKGKVASLKREKEDVKEVKKGLECGILLDNFKDFEEGDKLEFYNVTYLKQKL